MMLRSDARPEILDDLRRRQEPWLTALQIDTRGSQADARTAALLSAFPCHQMGTVGPAPQLGKRRAQ